MTAWNVPEGTVDAARTIIAAGMGANVAQAHDVLIRDLDPNEEHPRVLHLIPLGSAIGVAITKENEYPADKDILFIAAAALGSVLPALGFTATPVAAYISAPKDAPR